MNTTMKKQEGFTIIEVVLVLAIAALIMLMVFVALPALQRSQRDQQREQDVSRLSAAITQHKSRNNGNIPGTTGQPSWSDFFSTNMKGSTNEFNDPTGDSYTADTSLNSSKQQPPAWSQAESRKIYMYTNATCNGENVTAGGSSRSAVMVRSMEGGGFICQQA